MDHRRDIKHYVLKNFLFTEDEGAVADQDSLIKKGIVDSTGILELISHLEEKYGIQVAEEEMVPANFESIDAMTAFLGRKLGG
jgi:acyl carrier protein